MAAQRPACSAKNATGAPCRNPVVLESGLCTVHDPDSPVAVHFAPGHPPTPGAGRPPDFDAPAAVRRAITAEFDRWLSVLTGARDTGDARLALDAWREAIDRGWGKPTARTEVDVSGRVDLTLDQLYADTPNTPTNTPLEEAE